MSRHINLLAAALLPVYFLSANPAAACFTGNTNERLENYCLLQQVNRTSLSYNAAAVVDNRLKREGYSDGLGLPVQVKKIAGEPTFAVSPSIQYESDINGGNPRKV